MAHSAAFAGQAAPAAGLAAPVRQTGLEKVKAVAHLAAAYVTLVDGL
jgi:hypothetical protein